MAEDGTNTNLIESTWRVMGKQLGLGRIQGTLDYHLFEALWRRHCIVNNLDPFMNLLQLIRDLYPGKN